jgi:vacuolar-type H+-ATPase subunit I/STV1
MCAWQYVMGNIKLEFCNLLSFSNSLKRSLPAGEFIKRLRILLIIVQLHAICDGIRISKLKSADMK